MPFRPFAWPWNLLLLAVMLLPVLVLLGLWQLGRGEYKQQHQHHARLRLELPQLGSEWLLTPGADWLLRRVAMPEVAWGDVQLLLDNSLRDGKPGVEVIQPVNYNGRWFLVNRGWMPWSNRAHLPHPNWQATTSLTGQLRNWPQGGLQLKQAPPLQGDINVVTRLNRPAIQAWLGRQLAQHMVYLDQSSPNALHASWPAGGSLSAMRHYGYALQWFAMALALAILSMLVWWRHARHHFAANTR